MLLAFVLAPALTFAEVPSTLARPDPMTECLGKDSQGEMHRCADGVVQEQRTRLDAVLVRYRERLDPRKRRAFDEAQAAWATFQQRECEFRSSDVEGGSVQPTVTLLCLSQLIEQRIAQLDDVDHCDEGDR